MQKEKEAIVNCKEGRDIEMEGTTTTCGGKEETLPPGFRFHPTDEELITCYLINKISDSGFTGRAVTDIDLNKFEPWELPGKAKMGEKEWYFFNMRDRKYPTGVRTNRATNTGYWKTTGKDKEIFNSVTSELVGMKKTLVFYKGRAPRGEKSNWVMHEYRIPSKSTFRVNKQNDWVVCRVFKKSGGVKKYPSNSNHTRAMNYPYYSMDQIGPNINVAPPVLPMMHLGMGDPAAAAAHHFLYGRNYMNTSTSSAELAEIAKVLRGSGATSTTTTTTSVNYLPVLQQSGQLLNYPAVSASATAGGFTISGLNLNLGGGGGGGASMAQPHDHHVISSNMMPPAATISLGGTAAENNVGGYGTEMSNTNTSNIPVHGNNRYMGMDHCMDLDTYWPSY